MMYRQNKERVCSKEEEKTKKYVKSTKDKIVKNILNCDGHKERDKLSHHNFFF